MAFQARDERGTRNRISAWAALWILIRMAVPDRRSSVVLVAAMAVLVGGMFVLQSACYPWAHSLTFGPTLTGRWIGELTPAVRGKHVAFVDLWDEVGDAGGPDMSGKARLCDERGEEREFDLTGSPRNWRGTKFWFTTSFPENRDGEGVQLGKVDGEWDRADTLHVSAKLVLYQIHDGASHSSTDRPAEQIALEDTVIRFTLTRGNESQFRAACGRLRDQSHTAVR